MTSAIMFNIYVIKIKYNKRGGFKARLGEVNWSVVFGLVLGDVTDVKCGLGCGVARSCVWGYGKSKNNEER